MDYQMLQAEVVSHFPSATYRRYLEESGFLFPPEDLIAAIYHFVPRFEIRIRLWTLLAEVSPEVSDHIGKIISWQRHMVDKMMEHEDDMLYQLEIYSDPGDMDDEYLCRDYETCSSIIRRLLAEEDKPHHYFLSKRRLWHCGNDMERDVDCTGDMTFDSDGVLTKVWFYSSPDEYGQTWENREIIPVAERYPAIPAWFANGSVIRCMEYPVQGEYAIALTSHQTFTDCPDLYLIPISRAFPRHLDQETFEAHRDHIHTCSPWVEMIPTEELPEELQDSYWGLYEYLIQKP